MMGRLPSVHVVLLTFKLLGFLGTKSFLLRVDGHWLPYTVTISTVCTLLTFKLLSFLGPKSGHKSMYNSM